MGEKIKAYEVLVDDLTKVHPRRRRCKWEDNIKIDLKNRIKDDGLN
jgi:hypothetical protein